MIPAPIELFLAALLRRQGMPYRYGGKGMPGEGPGIDCSGTASGALRDAGDKVDRRPGWSANRYWTDLPHTETPEPGDFCLYGADGHANHIMTLMEGGKVFGACGGDHTTTTVEEAKRIGACVRWRSGPHYRNPDDLLGFVVNPLRNP